MKIAIDARALVSQKPVGKERFTTSVLEELFKLDHQNQYILYSTRDLQRSLPNNFSKMIIKAPGIFWHLFVLIDLIFKKPDTYFSSLSYLVPALNIFSKNIIVIYDLCVFLPIKIGFSLKTRLLERTFSKIAARRAKKIITISQSTKKDMVRYFQINPLKISVIYPGSMRSIVPDDKSKDALNKHNFPSSFILFVGTLEPRKNIIRLIEAYNLLGSKFKISTDVADKQCLRLVIAGKRGWRHQDVFAKVKELQLEDKIIFLGYVSDEDLSCLYNTAVCVVYPSLYEGFGLPILEAMASGCPVITSNTSAMPEAAGGAAILVNPNDADEIAGALNKLLINESLRQELKKQGLDWAKNFSWQKTAQEILKVLSSR